MINSQKRTIRMPAYDNIVQKHGALRVSTDGRGFEHADGTVFFWLADTAWELFHKLSREEIAFYFANRAKKGFTVIQAVVLAELDGLRKPNFYGDLPFHGIDPSQPNERYFAHVDWVVGQAAEIGLYIALLPTWGDKVNMRYDWAKGPEIFTAANAGDYGYYLGKRYGGYDNIVWILGGDRNPQANEAEVWRQMAAGVGPGVRASGHLDGKPLMSFHPQPFDGGSSARWFHEDDWLSFNMLQTGHDRDKPVYQLIRANYDLCPVKPVIDGEPTYEAHPIGFQPVLNGYSTDADVRKYAWWSLFSGACGHTYGCHSIWQFHRQGEQGVNAPIFTWVEALDLAGAGQMMYIRQLMEGRPAGARRPGQELIAGPLLAGSDHIVGTMAVDESFILVYTPAGREIVLDNRRFPPGRWVYHWYSPRDGRSSTLESVAGDHLVFTPATCGYGCDWILVLEQDK